MNSAYSPLPQSILSIYAWLEILFLLAHLDGSNCKGIFAISLHYEESIEVILKYHSIQFLYNFFFRNQWTTRYRYRSKQSRK